jgi:hypothetical protein
LEVNQMGRTSRQLCALLTVCCSVGALPASSDSIRGQDFRLPAEIAGEPCELTDPTDPQQILGPNPTRVDCLAGLYPGMVPTGTYTAEAPGPNRSSSESSLPLSLTATLWLCVAALGMLVLAGFNSRKKHRHLPTPGLSGGYSQPTEHLHTHTEGSRWHED